jgi:Ca-activated chloride channel family protein
MNVPQVLESTRLGMLVPVNEEDSPLPLEHTTVTAQVVGPLNTVAVTQRFTNPFSEPVELEYLFPLPHTAAIVDFELRIGSRTIQGDLQEIEQAREDYEKARREGRYAGLLEERRPNLFAVRIANVLPGEALLTTMRYQERLAYDDGCYAFIFPMGLTPKYHSPGNPEESRGVDAPIAGAGEHIGGVEISLAVDAGLPYGDPSSPSHKIETARLDDRRFSVRLGELSIPDHDFVLRYPVARDKVSMAAWRAKGPDADYFFASLLPPAVEGAPSEPPAREFIFVLDRSGSMSGGPIGQARNALRACLRSLNPQDQFSLLLFDNQLEWYRPKPCQVSQAEIDQADAYLSQVEGRGGTEIIPALQAALAQPYDEKYQRYIVFLTDGAVSAEERAFDQVRRNIGKARLFTFGIGPSVNRALLGRLAQLGRGTAEFLQLDEDIEGAILRFQDRVSFPALTDLSLGWENGKAWDVYPASLPDLFIGQPLEIVGRIKPDGSAPVRLEVTGQAGKEKVRMQLTFPGEAGPEPAVARAWARARVDDLLEGGAAGTKAPHQVRSEVIGLAIEQRLVTPYTAFVAVDSQPAVKDGKPLRTIYVAQPLPAGLDLEGFLGGYPGVQMAVAAHPPMPGMVYSAAVPHSPDQSINSVSESLPDVPTFLRKARRVDLRQEQPDVMAHRDLAAEPRNAPAAGDELLRWLARTQELNGSWKEDVELTAAALLAYLRAGFTPRAGYYRQQTRRAAEWLIQAQAVGTAAFTCAVVLAELAQATGEAGLSQSARDAVAALPKPVTAIEKAIVAHLFTPKKGVQALTDIHSLEDLRLAALLNAALRAPDELLKSDLGRIYAACLKRSPG